MAEANLATSAVCNSGSVDADKYSVAYVTVPNNEVAKTLAHGLVKQQLAACVNIIPQVTSVYMWKGEINEDRELLLMIKTRTSQVDQLTTYVRFNHPYEVCEVISLPIKNGNPPYLKWIGETVPQNENKELYKEIRGILNKLTLQNFDTLIVEVKHLEINNQKRLEGIIDLVFEKAIDEPNFSEAYAAMCNKLSTLKVPADNASSPDQCVNFRALIITKCQNQFVTVNKDEHVMKLEADLADTSDPAKKEELQLMLEEENRRVRMRSIGNVRFMGELYKLKMLTSKIMVYCMNHLIEKLEEEKLECLCMLLTTIGKQVESEAKDNIESVFKKMQDIVDRKSNKISSRVRFVIQDVIELRKRQWVTKSVVDSQLKMMDQIQKKAEQQQRHIELINANPMGAGFCRDDGGLGKRGDDRRQNNNSFMDNSNNWKTPRQNYMVDTSKFKGLTQNQKLMNANPMGAGFRRDDGGRGKRGDGRWQNNNSFMDNSNNWKTPRQNYMVDTSKFKGLTQNQKELYKKLRGILNKLTLQNFDTLIEEVKHLEINNQKRLEGVIDLVFEKAIDEPNFSEAYAAMCNKLSTLKVPADNASSPDQCVNFRALIITKCQNQFVTVNKDEHVMKLEADLAETSDPAKKKELQLMLEEENRRVRMRSIGNVRFIGELYKLKILTTKIMVYCMNHLIEKLEEEKLECLCMLLTTIGKQVESEATDNIESVFKKMQDIVDRKSNKISSRVRFVIQDVIELRKRRWVTIKSVVDSQLKMMDQIQKKAEQQQRHIELINANPMGAGFRRDDGGRGKRGDGRRKNNNSFMDNSNNWKTPRQNYMVDTSKFKGLTQNQKINSIKIAPQTGLGWNHGPGTKTTVQATGAGSNFMISSSKNMYSVLENVQTDPTSIRSKKFKRIYRCGPGSGVKSGSMGVARSNSGTRSTNAAPAPPASAAPPAAAAAPPSAAAPPAAAVPQEPLPDAKKMTVKSMIDQYLINSDNVELAADVKNLSEPQYHAALITEIITVAVEKSPKEVAITKSVLHLVSTNFVSGDNFIAGLKEFCEFAPDLYIDIPMLYDYLGWFITPQIETKYISFVEVFRLCDTIVSSNHGHLLLKSIIKNMKENMGPSFVKSKWIESGLKLSEWMSEDQVEKWLEDNKFEFLEGAKVCEETKNILTPAGTQSKLLQLMNSDESRDCIRGWVQDNLGKAANEEWFIRSLIQAICEHALFGAECRDAPRFNQERMNKYCGLINEFDDLKDAREAREASCLLGIQQLMHNLEHPQGITLEIFQYLHEQYIISVESFIAWKESQKELEGKAVMMKALTAFYTNIKKADNKESRSED